ncbi:MAG: ABC transporter substrate-binding protein [Prevotella sp.]|nr:ABC transporter substrate-binding protein [Prevotella sp.]
MKKLFFATVAFVVMLAGCGQSYSERQRLTRQERQRQKTADSLALKVGVMPTLDCLPLFLAKESGIFDTLGVDVRLFLRNAQMDIDTALIGGFIEGAVSDSIRVDRMIKKGVPLMSIGPTSASWQLITNRSARLKALSQLGDHMVAMTRYSATDYLTDYVLHDVKTQATVYRVQINDVSLRLKMLLNNEMDALWLPEPQSTAARLEKHLLLWDTNEHQKYLGVFAFRNKALADKRIYAQVELLMKAYNTACDSLNSRGLQHYGRLIETYCDVGSEIVNALPKVKFSRLSLPVHSNE